MILRPFLFLAACLLSFVLADVEVTGPEAGDTITGLKLSITWKDSGTSPALSDLASYQLFLCAGGNKDSNYIQLATLVADGDYTTGDSVDVTLTAGWGADVENAYFLKFISAATGGTVINFSDRFTLSGMTGTFSTTVTEGLATISGTDGPATENNIDDTTTDTTTAVAAGEYTVAYTLQTGTIRYAPMPPMAQTSITAKNASPQWPTSAYTVYKTVAGTPNAATTNTLALTFSTSSREATVAAAGQPTDTAMAKFLDRWKD
ncbi:hypothetical protein EDD37DRAFT_612858 [Exophiala viscosa]|uniref:Uncharacterized protein n=1 Tax=Exophiala viscosa TaxID=2486360 RepID=A0AAN6DNL3_9EURO|nr:hypothetical protein EDD36DRAFT_67479 [Exophiala viscosa]KAI1620650.1 hypothetical protein EDD37DRAFT_612858 [Exophiala viscosa]